MIYTHELNKGGSGDKSPLEVCWNATFLGVITIVRRLSVLLALAVAIISSGCGRNADTPSRGNSQPPSVASTATSEATDSPRATTSQDDSVPLAVSVKSTDYTLSIGGTDHRGETLYFIVGRSVRTEREAQAALDRAIPLFGDMQSYFIVQHSDGFKGLSPGRWVVIEAYRKPPSQENMEFARRAFPDAYVKRATVDVSALIPVYEDLVEDP